MSDYSVKNMFHLKGKEHSLSDSLTLYFSYSLKKTILSNFCLLLSGLIEQQEWFNDGQAADWGMM